LALGERNYLELYGIPPALSVLRRRFLEDASRDCMTGVDTDKLLSIDEIRTWGASSEQKEFARHRSRAARLESARAAAGAADLESLASANSDPRVARDIREH